MLRCSDCDNAAFDSSGVYCTALGEHIFDESVAETCGLYEGPARVAGGPGEADIIALNGRSADDHGGETTSVRIVRAGVVSSNDDDVDEDNEEQERLVIATVEVAYFGRARDGRQLLEMLRRICQLEFGSVEVR